MKKGEISILLFVYVFFLFILMFSLRAGAFTSSTDGNLTLAIQDSSDVENRFSDIGVLFNASLVNSTGDLLNATYGNALCQIRFDFTGSYGGHSNMVFNSTDNWAFNRSFNYKGTHMFEINCTSDYGNITLNETFVISNTAPSIDLDLGGSYIDFDGNQLNSDYWLCTEDTLCTYNFSANVTEPDVNDVLVFNYSSSNTTLTNFSLNSSTGMLEINITNDDNTGSKQAELTVRDSESVTKLGILRVNITAVNDAPVFNGLTNKSFNISSLFEYVINVTDEENDTLFNLNITFVSCDTADWSTREDSDCDLFNSSDYVFNETTGLLNISFIPTRNDVGDYVINFTVNDSGTPTSSNTLQVNFTVNNINLAPYFTYVCDNERNTIEDSELRCFVNASDIDEVNNLTFITNYTWFIFNSTGSNYSIVGVNSSTSFNGTAIINFTSNDTMVGNWSINMSVRDTGSPLGINSTVIYFYISNLNDSVNLWGIPNITAYTSNNYTIYFNATDDDLLIPDKNVYNESLVFVSNTSWVDVNIFRIVSGTNRTEAKITFDPNNATGGASKNYTINLTVMDANNHSIDYSIFNIEVLGNTAPQWNETIQGNHSLTEGTAFYLNLSKNVTDDEGDSLTFSYYNSSRFDSFSLDANTGEIDFTPIDIDVGYHSVTINVSDGVSSTPFVFNFTVSNVNDNPEIQVPLQAVNATVYENSNLSAVEDNVTKVTLWIHDDDVRILDSQKSFYNETFTINVSINGPNSNLFEFVKTNDFPTSGFPQRFEYDAIFTPNKSDVGDYNLIINITDLNGINDTLDINLTVSAVEHPPTITNVSNVTSSIEESIYLNFNSTDTEDINETYPGGNLTYIISNLSTSGGFLTINETTGVINFTLNSTFEGVWLYNVSVNDTSGLRDDWTFKLTVYGYPKIVLPNSDFEFSLVENVTRSLNFTVNDSVSLATNETVNYTIYIDGVIRNSTLGNGNSTAFLWNFTANFTDETTCSGVVNLTLNVSNSKLSNSTTWNITINHTNYPLSFIGNIGGLGKAISGGSPQELALSSYFSDIDASDSCVNQTIGFNYTLLSEISGGSISVDIVNWTNTSTPSVIFSATQDSAANYTITGMEFNSSNSSQIIDTAESNVFNVSLTVITVSQPTQSSGGGGGGGGSVTVEPISLRILVPEPVSAKRKDHLVLPLALVNDGTVDLNEIVLFSSVAKNGLPRDDLVSSFDRSFFPELKVGQRENLTLIVDIDTEDYGTFEITVNATVRDPEYSDWAKVFINVEETEKVEERILFTEEFIIGNPECAELKELVDEARRLFSSGDLEEARAKADEALEACRQAIDQRPRFSLARNLENNVFSYLIIASLVAVALGFVYHFYKRATLNRKLIKVKENFANPVQGF